MQFHWWTIGAVAAAIWISGWFVSAIFIFFFDPLTSPEEKRKDWRGRLIATCVLNWVLWPWLLPGFWRRYWFYHDMRTGKRPNWLVSAHGEQFSQSWVLSDGIECGASAHGGTSTEASRIEAFYVEEQMSALIEYRIIKIAPTLEEFSEWRPMFRDEDNLSDDKEGFIDYETKYEATLPLSRGKYRVEFRIPNRAGKPEEPSGVTFIVADHEEYADA